MGFLSIPSRWLPIQLPISKIIYRSDSFKSILALCLAAPASMWVLRTGAPQGLYLRNLFKLQHQRIPSGCCKPHPCCWAIPGITQRIFSQLNICVLGMDGLFAAFISNVIPTLHLKQQRSPGQWSWGHFQLQALFFPSPDELFLNICWKPFFPCVCNSTNPSCWGHKVFSKHSLPTSLSQFPCKECFSPQEFPSRSCPATGQSCKLKMWPKFPKSQLLKAEIAY